MTLATFQLTPDVFLYHADAFDALRALPPDCLDSCCTDPPYHLTSVVKRFGSANAVPAQFGTDGAFARASRGFMGKEWDGGDIAFRPEFWAEVLRVLKPGAHLAAFGASRGYHRMACAIEDAGFEVRDSLMWIYGTGFPKSHDVSKGVDKMDAAAARRERQLRFTAWIRSTGLTSSRIDAITGTNMGGHYTTEASQPAVATRDLFEMLRPHIGCAVPAWVEAMVDERTVESENFKRRQVLDIKTYKRGDEGTWTEHTTNDGSLYAAGEKEHVKSAAHTPEAAEWSGWGTALKPAFEPIVLARKPLSEGTVAANVMRWRTGAINVDATRIHSNTESTARTYTAKRTAPGATQNATGERKLEGVTFEGASKEGRWPANVVHDGSDEVVGRFPSSGPAKSGGRSTGRNFGPGGDVTIKDRARTGHDDNGGSAARFFYSAKASKADRAGSKHPTVKPISLIAWLARLITPPGGVVLDPFSGSGTTGAAAAAEGFRAVLIEREAEYVADIRARFGLKQAA